MQPKRIDAVAMRHASESEVVWVEPGPLADEDRPDGASMNASATNDQVDLICRRCRRR